VATARRACAIPLDSVIGKERITSSA
jgi:hypothetical protein